MRKTRLFPLIFAGLLLCLLLLSGCNEKREITVGILAEGLPMCEKTESGVAGFEAELAELTAERMKAHVAYKTMTATELSEALLAGKIDMAMGMDKQSADAEGFICLPYLTERQVLCVSKSSGITGLSGMAGKQAVVEKNSPADSYLAANPDTKHSFSVVTYTEDIYSALLDTVVTDYDGAILTDSLAGYYVTGQGLELNILTDAFPGTEKKRCIVFSSKRDALSVEVKQALSDLWAEGALGELSVKWFGSDITCQADEEMITID